MLLKSKMKTSSPFPVPSTLAFRDVKLPLQLRAGCRLMPQCCPESVKSSAEYLREKGKVVPCQLENTWEVSEPKMFSAPVLEAPS